VQSADCFSAAFDGGVYADRFAWVFMAGYQAAIRDTFPAQQFNDWVAFAVSEDRTGTLAPVTYSKVLNPNEADTYLVSGYKTWVAASDHVQNLVIKAGRGAAAVYLRVPRATSGVEVLTGAPGKTLPDLSQGRVHLSAAQFSATAILDQSRVKGFGAREAFFVLVAFLGWTYRAHAELRSQAQPLIESAGTFATDTIDRNSRDFRIFADAVQVLVEAAGKRVDDPAWHRDKRLVQMYASHA
jgi:hypothetical protein